MAMESRIKLNHLFSKEHRARGLHCLRWFKGSHRPSRKDPGIKPMKTSTKQEACKILFTMIPVAWRVFIPSCSINGVWQLKESPKANFEITVEIT